MRIPGILLIPVAALAFAACNKDDTTSGGNDVIPRSKVDARVKNSVYYSTETQAMQSGNLLSVIGVRNLGTGKQSAIALQLKHYTGPGSYRIDTATQASYTDVGVLYTADSGVVVITGINSEKYAGSFGFRAMGPDGAVRVTEGVIEVYK
jgi:hypothetical protein